MNNLKREFKRVLKVDEIFFYYLSYKNQNWFVLKLQFELKIY